MYGFLCDKAGCAVCWTLCAKTLLFILSPHAEGRQWWWTRDNGICRPPHPWHDQQCTTDPAARIPDNIIFCFRSPQDNTQNNGRAVFISTEHWFSLIAKDHTCYSHFIGTFFSGQCVRVSFLSKTLHLNFSSKTTSPLYFQPEFSLPLLRPDHIVVDYYIVLANF